MKRKPLLSRRLKLCAAVCTFVSGSMAMPTTLNAQLTKNYATSAISHSTGAAFSGTYNVPDFANASDGTEATFATLQATTVLTISTNSFVEMGFSANVPAGATVYIPVQDDPAQGLLSTLAGGSIGDLVTGLLGDQYFQVQVKTSTGSNVVTYSSAGNGTRSFAQGNFNFVTGPDGQIYITFKAATGVDYSRIRVTAQTSGLVAASYELKVQDAFYLSGTATPCTPFVTTSFDAAGLSLSLLNGSGAPVKNIQRVIDSDTTNFSTFGYGTVNVGALSSISQDVYFSNLSNPGDGAKVKFSVPSSLLSLGVLGNISITAYRNDTIVATNTLNSLLSLQALGIITLSLNNNIPVAVQLPVGSSTAQFNRVRVTFQPTLGVGANQLLQLYGVDRVAPQPVLNTTVISTCPATTSRISITNVTPGVSYAWYNSSNTLVGTDSFYVPMAPAVGVTDTYYVTASDCPGKQSVGTVVTITGNTASCVSVSSVAYLGGAFDMVLNRNRDVSTEWAAILAASATVQPYSAAPFNYSGGETVDPLIFTATAAETDIMDWMLLELKDSTGLLIDRKAVFILENGNITNLDKTQPVVLKAAAGAYHLTVRHRNHLGMSTNLINFVPGNNTFNFTTATDAQIFGDANAYAILNGMNVMIAGNANGNGFISYSGSGNDRAIILSVLNGNNSNVLNSIYSSSDLNLSGSVFYSGSGNDRAIILNALNGNVASILSEQIK